MNILFGVLCSEGNIDRTLNVRKMKDIIPELKVVFSNRQNVFDNHIALFSWCVNSDADGIIVLEDDVQLCKNFKDRAFAIIEKHPNEVVSMFESACSKKELHSEYRNGGRFAWNQCNYYPKEICKLFADENLLHDFIEYYKTTGAVWNYPIDTYQAWVLGKHGINYWMEVPFLVQHLSMKSNFKGRPMNRQSRFFIDDVEGKG